MQYLMHEIQPSQDDESMKNNKIKWIDHADHKNVEKLFNGANDLVWKLGSEEIIDYAKRLPLVLGKSHSETHGNELTSIFEYFMNEHSSLVKIMCSTCKISYLEWLKFLLVCNGQKTYGLSCTEVYSNDCKIETKHFLTKQTHIDIWNS